MSGTELISLVCADIEEWLSSLSEMPGNERDMQIHLAFWLRTVRHRDVILEYYIPAVVFPDSAWKSELYIDIVVSFGNCYIPVELKYKTQAIHRQSIKRFGESLDYKVPIVKNQAAQNLGRYDFWKDVRRLELVSHRFRCVPGGVAVFLTNDPAYLANPKPMANHFEFSMAEGEHPKSRHWQRATSLRQKHPDFMLDGDYTIRWHKLTIDDEPFHYLTLTV